MSKPAKPDMRTATPRPIDSAGVKAAATPARRPRAKRLAPDVRRALILDAAGDLVLERGVSAFTLDDVATSAKISTPLVYKYFPSRDALLGALLQREFDHIRGRHLNLLSADATAEEAHRIHIRRYLEYIMERGALMRALVSDAGVAGQVRETAHLQQASITQFWVDKTMETYGLPKELARMGMIMTITAMEGAEGSLRLGKVELERAADFWTTFILAGWKATSERFSVE